MMMNTKHGIMMTFGATHLSGSANANAVPTYAQSDLTSDAGLALLHRITGL